MYKQKKIGITIPAYNEEDFIGLTLKSIPDFIDKIYVTNDCSRDNTAAVIEKYAKKDKRITLFNNEKNSGNGFSLTRGLRAGLKDQCDVMCIMAGDNQCRPEYLKKLISAVVDQGYDYAKANRFAHSKELQQMPLFRRFGNSFMSILSKFASGYYSIVDPLNSYSATSSKVLKKIPLDQIPHRYEFENGWLYLLYMANATIKDVPVPAKYAGEKSDIRLFSFMYRSTKVMLKGLFKRMYVKYVVYSFHPVALFFFSGLSLFLFGLLFGLYVTINSIGPNTASTATVMLSVVPFIVGFQLLLQAVVLDIHSEPKLHKT